MAIEEYQRKLTAILSADVVGYSLLMRDDESATVSTITRFRAVFTQKIQQHRGRVVDSPGDNILSEFASVVDAVKCAVEIQKELDERNKALPDNRRMRFRIGINIGDVIEEKERIYGDGVNIAARLESLADPGGINMSGTAYSQVKGKLPYHYEFMGEHTVKNISDPVKIFKVVMDFQASADGKPTIPKKPNIPVFRLSIAIGGIMLLAAAFYYWANRHAQSLISRSASISSVVEITQGASIAVLPFKNLSGDPEQEYFTDGITNDIITDLSRFRNLLVIASNTVFTYKGQNVNISKIGQNLRVRYVLEGSIQKMGNTVRINAQLIDASNETHIWAERYDREYKDIFSLQEDIVQAIVAKLAIQTFRHEQNISIRKEPQDLQAYDYLLQGWAHYQRRNQASNIRAGDLFTEALSIDPNYASAYVGVGWVNWAKVSYGWTEFPQQNLENAYIYARRALELDSSNSSAHSLLSNVYTFRNQYDLAIREAEQAIQLNPNDATSYSQMGWVLVWSGRLDEAIVALEKSIRLDSAYPGNAWLHLGMAYYLKGQYVEALKVLENGVVKNPDFSGYYIVLAAVYARLNRQQDAEGAVENLLRRDPFFKVTDYGTAFRNPSHRKALVDGLRLAGLK